jgi:4-hydroxyphenylacetate 3-monooxygenase
VMANHQCNVRFGTKLRFMVAIASLLARATGARDIPAVRDTLGRLAAMEAGYNAMIDGQIEAYLQVDHGFALYNRRYVYAAINWAMENHSTVIRHHARTDGRRTVSVSASIEVVDDPALGELFATYWTAGEHGAVDRMKLFKLAWDLIGSDHASRATSYEKFFVGPTFAVRNYNFINAPWDELHQIAEDFMATYGYESAATPQTTTDMRATRSAKRSG